MSLFGKIFGGKTVLGVDIGTTSVKIAELKLTSGKPTLKNYAILESHGHLEQVGSAIQASNLKLMNETTANYLKSAVEGLDTKNREAVASVPTFSSFTALLEMPAMSEADTAKAMQFQVKQYVPLPLSEVTNDWVKIGEKTDEAGRKIQRILLVSIPNEIIEKYKVIFQLSGLNLAGLEVEGISMSRALTFGNPETALIVDIGSRSTNLLIAQNGFLKSVSQTDFASSSLTQNLASGASLSAYEAEALKRQRGLAAAGAELSTLMLPVLDAIINEARSVKDSFEAGYNERVKRVILTGGGANLAGADKYFAEQLGLPASLAKPFSLINYPAELEPSVPELSPVLAIAIGLAMRNA